MTTDELEDTLDQDAEGTDAEGQEPEPLELDVQVESPTACQRHITVTIPREDIDRYYDEAFSEMMEKTAVPGFRAGRAPRKLVEARYRKDVTDQIKGSLLMDSMAQINEEHDLAAISEPDIDVDAVEVPDEGPMTFEFDLEVRPEFDLPPWKGLQIERPVRDFTADDVNRQLQSALAEYGRMAPTNEAAREGDYVTANVTVKHDGKQAQRFAEQSVCLRPALSFRDGKIENFLDLMKDVQAGETREAKMTLSSDAPNEALAGEEVDVIFEVLDVKKFELPELTDEILGELGNFDSEGDLRDAVEDRLKRQLEYEQQRRVRQQVTQSLTEAASWELPPELLKRQSSRELERSVMELRRSGFPEATIQAHANDLRQNSQENTAKSLREHFILERIAEDEEIEAAPEDYDREIELMAMQSGDSPRRVRARIEKQGLMDALRNQIVERTVIDRVLEHAKFKDVPFQPEKDEVEALSLAAGGGDTSDIPVAEHAEAETLSEPKEHH